MVALILVVTVGVLAAWIRRPAPAPVVIMFVYSSDASDLVNAEAHSEIKAFNDSHMTVDGHPVVVKTSPVAMTSGEAERAIEEGRLHPALWMPASSLWTELLNQHRRATWAPPGPSLVHSPQIVVIWEPLARRLGWPVKSVRWDDLFRLGRTDPQYRYGHTNPDFSTSGITALIAEYATASGHTPGGLRLEDVANAGINQAVRHQEGRIVHYGDTANAFLDQMYRYGPSYASWVVTQEYSLVKLNEEHPDAAQRLVAIYPGDGTYLADYPLSVLSHAAGVDRLHRTAAEHFRQWLLTHVTERQAAALGYRSGALNQRAVSPIDRAHGANPDPPFVTPLPPSSVVGAIQGAWARVRRPADVGLVVDATCLTPDGGRAVREGTDALLSGFSERDRVGLWTAGATVEEPVTPTPLRRVGDDVRSEIAAMAPSSTSRLYDAIASARDAIASLPKSNRLRGVIVLTDGRSDVSRISLIELVHRLQGETGADRVRVFAAACTPNPDLQVLDDFTSAAQGHAFPYDAADIGKVYRSLSSYY